MSEDLAIKVEGVSKDFRLPHEKIDSIKSIFVNPFKKKGEVETQHALKDISFEVKKGEFFGIVGRNGSGKSTLLKIIAGIYQPTKGALRVNGRLVPFIELGVGFNPELTGKENTYLNGALMGYTRREITAKYDDIVNFSELERFMDQKLKNYSSGMQVRLAFSVATILAESDILLIDEVLAVGDADFQKKCFRYFNQLKAKGRTVVFISHDMAAVERFCDRAMLIDGSKVIEIGEPAAIAKLYNKLFVGSTTQLDGVRRGGGEIKLKNVKVKADKNKIKVSAEAKSNGIYEQPVFGISINTENSDKIAGTNTKIEKVKSLQTTAGENLKFEWEVDNIFSTGRYSVDLTIHSNDLGTVFDWWENAAYFDVEKDLATPYYNIDIPFQFTQVENRRAK